MNPKAKIQITSNLSSGFSSELSDSYCYSWQKGAIENANKLIREHIPKKTNFDLYNDRRIMLIQKKPNRRPRGKPKFETPKKRFSENFN